jgi:hypothetical protein
MLLVSISLPGRTYLLDQFQKTWLTEPCCSFVYRSRSVHTYIHTYISTQFQNLGSRSHTTRSYIAPGVSISTQFQKLGSWSHAIRSYIIPGVYISTQFQKCCLCVAPTHSNSSNKSCEARKTIEQDGCSTNKMKVKNYTSLEDSGHFLRFLWPERGQELHQGLGLELGQWDQRVLEGLLPVVNRLVRP